MNKLNKDFIDYLLEITKIPEKKKVKIPLDGEKDIIELITFDRKEKVMLDINRKGRSQLKVTIQKRYKTIPIIRVDLDAPPHMNSDGRMTSRNHIHFYNPETETNDAINLEEIEWIDKDNINFSEVFYSFCDKFNIELGTLQVVI